MSTRKVAKFVEAKREYDALVRQRERYPELKDSLRHRMALTEARAAMLALLRTLTGGEIGLARQLEAKQKETTDA